MDLSKSRSAFIGKNFLLTSEASGSRTKKKAGPTNLFALETCQLVLKQLAYLKKQLVKFVRIPTLEGCLHIWHYGRHFT